MLLIRPLSYRNELAPWALVKFLDFLHGRLIAGKRLKDAGHLQIFPNSK